VEKAEQGLSVSKKKIGVTANFFRDKYIDLAKPKSGAPLFVLSVFCFCFVFAGSY